MNIMVETAEGIAAICGDVIYDILDQVIEPFAGSTGYVVLNAEPTQTGNYAGTNLGL